MQDQWILPFRSGQVCFDQKTKEMVKISNGTCVLDHSSQEKYAEAHKGRGCQYEPSEAIALRVVTLARTKRGGDPVIAFTYRGVTPKDLSVAGDEAQAEFDSILLHTRRSRYIGRI